MLNFFNKSSTLGVVLSASSFCLATTAQAELITFDLAGVNLAGEEVGAAPYGVTGSVTFNTQTGQVVTSTVQTPTDTYATGEMAGPALELIGANGGSLLLTGFETPAPSEAFLGVTYLLMAPEIVELTPDGLNLVGIGGPPEFDWNVVMSGNAPVLPGSIPNPGPTPTSVITGDAFGFFSAVGDLDPVTPKAWLDLMEPTSKSKNLARLTRSNG